MIRGVVHTIPVYEGHTPEESWALIREGRLDQRDSEAVPAFVARLKAGEEPRWANVMVDLSGRLIKVLD